MFAERLRQWFPGLEPGKIAALEGHWQLLRLWNRKLNLTTVDDLDAAVERHYAESLFLGFHVSPGALDIADVGSGPGVPGVSGRRAAPGLHGDVDRVTPAQGRFPAEASRKQPNIRVMAKRAEELAGGFDVAISRAVSYRDLEGSLRRLTSRAMLLTGQEPPPDSLGFIWEPPIPLPWGEHRVLRIGTASS